jgi:hypothetical protein
MDCARPKAGMSNFKSNEKMTNNRQERKANSEHSVDRTPESIFVAMSTISAQTAQGARSARAGRVPLNVRQLSEPVLTPVSARLFSCHHGFI